MKIFWLCNIVLPDMGKNLGITYSQAGGWMIPFLKRLIQYKNNEITVCTFRSDIKETKQVWHDNVCYIVFPKEKKNLEKYDVSAEKYLYQIFKKNRPDLVHIWGTEFPHTLSAIKVCHQLKLNNVISIQGLISACGREYLSKIDRKYIYRKTIRDIIKKDSIKMQQKKFIIRGDFEKESIKIANNIIGRTDWDKAIVTSLNREINYYFCNECLRDPFYLNTWDINNIEKYTLFMSQGNYPLKGLHKLIEAINIVALKYPNLKLYVAGGMSIYQQNFSSKLRRNYYEKYILKLIDKYALKNNIIFLPTLNEQEMCERYLKSHIFISPSAIENSSNSVGEAMILGMPIISSFVGGISSMIDHKIEGLLYPFNEVELLASYIINIFNDDILATSLSKNARKKALLMFDREKNSNTMFSIYKKIVNTKI